ncbi:hypothetical protein [Rosenbergiella epipactidis]|uniref:hypothetical protein n=1 Tax=Rosenbergiella epipactidis TaxID=1544694 RepID=UPI001F4E0987|nr:hypothetical protein [Rosenbergiella epipactidis]
MIKTVLAGFEKLCRFKDFYSGTKPESLQFYQLGEGYLTLFSHLYRQTTNSHYLHRPASDPFAYSPLRLSAQRISNNAQRGKQALAQQQLSEVLSAVGQQIMLATATIASSDQGLYLAATLYNRAESFDRYRTFVEDKRSLSTGIETWFENAIDLTALLTVCEVKAANRVSIRQQFSDYQRYRLVMNRLYVVINQGFFLLNRATVDIIPFITALHQSHLSERWNLTQQQKIDYFAQQQRDIREVIFVEGNEGTELCYHLESGLLIESPNAIKPDISQAVQFFAQQLHSTASAHALRENVRKKALLKGLSEPVTALK